MERRRKAPEHVNIGEFNRGKSSMILHRLSQEDLTAIIQKNGKPMAVVISYERYQRLFREGIDVNDY